MKKSVFIRGVFWNCWISLVEVDIFVSGCRLAMRMLRSLPMICRRVVRLGMIFTVDVRRGLNSRPLVCGLVDWSR